MPHSNRSASAGRSSCDGDVWLVPVWQGVSPHGTTSSNANLELGMEQWLIVILATAGLLVRVGLMLYAAGGARAKMASSALMRQLIDLCVAVLALWAVGWAIWSYTGNPVIGLDVHRLIGWNAPEAPVSMESLLVVLLAS